MTRFHFPSRNARRTAAGFTLLELLVVLAVILIVSVLAFRGFREVFIRGKLVGDTVAIANSLQRARAAALRHGTMVVGEIDGTAQELVFFFNEDQTGDNLVQNDPDDENVFPPLTLSQGRQTGSTVYFWSHPDTTPDAAKAMDGFTQRTSDGKRVLVIERDGSIRDLGGIRIAMGQHNWTDAAQVNFMEVRVVTTGTGKTQLRKFIPGEAVPYQPKFSTSDGTNWEF